MLLYGMDTPNSIASFNCATRDDGSRDDGSRVEDIIHSLLSTANDWSRVNSLKAIQSFSTLNDPAESHVLKSQLNFSGCSP